MPLDIRDVLAKLDLQVDYAACTERLFCQLTPLEFLLA